MHSKQHGEVYLLLPWKSQVHRQFLISPVKPRQPCRIQQTRGEHLSLGRASIPTSTWTPLRSLTRLLYHRRKPSTVNWQIRIYLMKTTNTPRKSGKPMNARRWATTTISTSQQTHSFSQMYLRTSEKHVSNITAWTQSTITQVQD